MTCVFGKRPGRAIAATRTLLACALLGATTALAQAGTPLFDVPVDCAIGPGACALQNYVDHDPGPRARDYACGHLTYDGHKGTDIRVANAAVMRKGVAVLAAAAGTVRAVRDGMADINVRANAAGVAGREAGNSVVIDHGDGWETQYAHLRSGSVAVRPGDRIEAGRRIGQIGLSGNSEFPHVHFEVRYRGMRVDPFTGAGSAAECGPGKDALWSAGALTALSYAATGILGAGFASAPPMLEDGGVDLDRVRPFTAVSAALVFWVSVYGLQAGDVEDLKLAGPDGAVIAARLAANARNRAVWLSYTGRKRAGDAWPAGIYRAQYTIRRGDSKQQAVTLLREFTLDPR